MMFCKKSSVATSLPLRTKVTINLNLVASLVNKAVWEMTWNDYEISYCMMISLSLLGAISERRYSLCEDRLTWKERTEFIMVGKFSGHGTKTNIRAVAPRVCVCIYSYIGSVVWSNASFMLALSHSLLMSIHVRSFLRLLITVLICFVCIILFSFRTWWPFTHAPRTGEDKGYWKV